MEEPLSKIVLRYYPPVTRHEYTHNARADQSLEDAVADALNRLYDSFGVVDTVTAVQVDNGDWLPLHIVKGDAPGTWRQVLPGEDAPPSVPAAPMQLALVTETEAYAQRRGSSATF